jgi:hypothetical protein
MVGSGLIIGRRPVLLLGTIDGIWRLFWCRAGLGKDGGLAVDDCRDSVLDSQPRAFTCRDMYKFSSGKWSWAGELKVEKRRTCWDVISDGRGRLILASPRSLKTLTKSDRSKKWRFWAASFSPLSSHRRDEDKDGAKGG